MRPKGFDRTQAFYERMGCVDTEWIFQDQADREPYDIQLEYAIG